MTSVLMSFQLFHVLYKSGSKWVQMSVTHQFQQINVLHRLIPILEEVAASAVSAVIPKGITGHKPSHDRRDGNCAGSEQEVEMMWWRTPGASIHDFLGMQTE